MKKYIKSDNDAIYTFDELSEDVQNSLISDFLDYRYEDCLKEIERRCTEYVKTQFPNSELFVDADSIVNSTEDGYIIKIGGELDYYDALQKLKTWASDLDINYLTTIITPDLQLDGKIMDYNSAKFDEEGFLSRLETYIDYENLQYDANKLFDFAIACKLYIASVEDFLYYSDEYTNVYEIAGDIIRNEDYYYDENGENAWSRGK